MLCLQIKKLKSPFLCVCDSIKVVLLFFEKPFSPASMGEFTGETSFNCFYWESFGAVIFRNLKKKKKIKSCAGSQGQDYQLSSFSKSVVDSFSCTAQLERDVQWRLNAFSRWWCQCFIWPDGHVTGLILSPVWFAWLISMFHLEYCGIMNDSLLFCLK